MDSIEKLKVQEIVSDVESELFDDVDLEIIVDTKIEEPEDINTDSRVDNPSIEVDILSDIFDDEFTCTRCFLIKKNPFLSQSAPKKSPFCVECE